MMAYTLMYSPVLLTVLAENPDLLLENCPGSEHDIWVTSATWIQSIVRAKKFCQADLKTSSN